MKIANNTTVDESKIALAPKDRLAESASIDVLVQHIAEAYSLDEVVGYSEICVGYEDCNVIIETTTEKYVAKLFARTRTDEEVNRYLEIMKKVAEAGVSHPELLINRNGSYVLHHLDVWMVLANFIGGSTFYDLNRTPSDQERRVILGELSKINQIDHSPPYIAGSWIVPRFYDMYEKTKPYLTADEIEMLEYVAERYDRIPFDDLERCFIHGDIRTTNVLLGDNNKIYILDYFLANNYIKIQELAVAAATLFFDPSSTKTLDELCGDMVREYGDLHVQDSKFLADYTLAVFAMEFMGGTYARNVQKNLTEENTYWLERGKAALIRFAVKK